MSSIAVDSTLRSKGIFGLVCAVAIAFEVYLVFVYRGGAFRIEGERAYDVIEFTDGATVSQAFLMRGDGLQAVRVRFSSDAAASVKLQWTLWRGYADHPSDMTRAFEGVQALDLRPGRQWKSLTFTRDGSSNDRWYTIQLVLLEHQPDRAHRVAVVASSDNPERGGALWVNDRRQTGSLFMQAERRDRTLYRRFLAEVGPNLPPVFRIRTVQRVVFGAFHWALIVFAYAVITDGWKVQSARSPL